MQRKRREVGDEVDGEVILASIAGEQDEVARVVARLRKRRQQVVRCVDVAVKQTAASAVRGSAGREERLHDRTHTRKKKLTSTTRKTSVSPVNTYTYVTHTDTSLARGQKRKNDAQCGPTKPHIHWAILGRCERVRAIVREARQISGGAVGGDGPSDVGPE